MRLKLVVQSSSLEPIRIIQQDPNEEERGSSTNHQTTATNFLVPLRNVIKMVWHFFSILRFLCCIDTR